MNSGVSVPGLLADLLRLSGADRPHDLSLPAIAPLDSTWVVASWHGHEALGPHGLVADAQLVTQAWWVDLVSPDADLPLDAMLGQPATLWTRTATGDRVARTGLVATAEQLGRDESFARYRLQLVPWTWLLAHGRHSRVFQDRTVLQIVETVLADYAPHAAWQVADDVGPFLEGVPPRSYCVQYRETDAAFLARLLAEEGLGGRIESFADTSAGHRLVIFADSTQAPEELSAAIRGGIRFHRSDATEEADAVQALGALRALGATSLTLLSHDYKRVAAITAQIALGAGDTSSAHDRSGGTGYASGAADDGNVDSGLPPLELYDPVGAYAFADRDAAQRVAERLADAHDAHRQRWLGRGTVRSFAAGTRFALLGAPADRTAVPDEVVLTAIWHAGINPLPEGLATHARLPAQVPGLAPATWHAVTERASAVGYANAFLAVPRPLPWRPLLAADAMADHPAAAVPRLNARPTAPGYQTAIVVGPEGETQPQGARELHCDGLGRIRVRFHWQGPRDDSDATGATGIAADSCWLRVAQRYAGPGVGTQFLPRIGQEVLIAFLDGDIDRPVVVGALYNGRGDEGQGNHAGGAAPAWHGARAAGDQNAAAMLGIKSKEFGGSGHNRLVFDDSDGQLRLQLATTHAATELNLGYLIRQDDNRRGQRRGEGFELRTDQWGAVRAERGLWISAYGATAAPASGSGGGAVASGNGNSPAGEHVAATALLKQATKLGETLSGIAGTHLTPRIASHEGTSGHAQSALIADQAPLKALLTSASTVVGGDAWDKAVSDAPEHPSGGAGRVPHTGDALLGLSAPAGIGLVAGQSLQWSMGETLTLASGGASNVATAGDLRVHAGQALGWLASAVEGASEEAVALSLVSAEGKLEFEAQNDQLKLQSRDGLKLVSANAEVELAAGKAIHLATSGGASISIEGGNISVACPGTIKVQAGKKSFLGPTQLSREMNSWLQAPFNERFQALYADGEPASRRRYAITRADGARIHGATDELGYIDLQQGLGPEHVVIEILGEEQGARA